MCATQSLIIAGLGSAVAVATATAEFIVCFEVWNATRKGSQAETTIWINQSVKDQSRGSKERPCLIHESHLRNEQDPQHFFTNIEQWQNGQ